MDGKNHLVTGAALAVDTGLLMTSAPVLAPAASVLSPFAHYGHDVRGWTVCGVCAALYLFGSVLPDVDNHGLVSKWLHFSLPLNHRGWTHSVWAMVPFVLASLAVWPVLYIALGMLAHDLMDSLSQAGWVMFYPLGRWRTYKGIVMARGWTPSLYSSTRPGSENVVAGLFVLISVLFWAFWAYLTFF